MKYLYTRILRRAIELKGDAEALASHIGTTPESIKLWSEDRATIPPEIIEKVLDVLLDADVRALSGPSQAQDRPLPRVLVVDDDPGGAYSLARVLRQLGHAVEIAADGPAALTTARKFRPDVVFVDLRMPGMDGVEIAQLLKAEGLGTHIVAATAYPAELERHRTSAAGFAAHLVKPIDQHSLSRVLTELH